MFKFLRELMAPADLLVGNEGIKELSVEGMIDELGKDDEKIDENKEDLLDDKEPELNKEDELELEEIEPEIDEGNIQDVPRKEILKKYPTIFKEFPQLEHAYYREQKYAELLPTLDDAREAVEKAQNYEQFSNAVFNGDVGSILNSVKTSDDKAFGKVVDNYLPALGKVDANAYYHVIGGVIKNTIAAMVQEGGRIDNENLKAAAVILNQFIFGSSEFKPPTTFSKQTDQPTTELQNERAQFVQERFNSTLEDLTDKANNVIKSTISQHIDPKGTMTDYVKRTAIREAMQNVDELIGSDARFKSTLDKLWEQAFKSNFSVQSRENIKKAYLNKAKTLLPSIIQKHRNEALKGLGKRITETREEPEKKGLITRGRTAGAENTGKKNEVPKGMKTLDFLMQD